MHLKKKKYQFVINSFLILIIFTSLYSALNMSGIFILDFFKYNLMGAVFYDEKNIIEFIKTKEGLMILGYFLIKIILSLFLLTKKDSNGIKYSFALFFMGCFYALEAISTRGDSCDIGEIYYMNQRMTCIPENIGNPLASIMIFSILLAILVKEARMHDKK